MTNDVRALRLAAGLSQRELAQTLQVSRQTINAIEAEKYSPSLTLGLKIARVFSKTVDEIFELEEED